MGILSAFSKKVPKDPEQLFNAAAAHLPWVQHGEHAIIPPKIYEHAKGYQRELIAALEKLGEGTKNASLKVIETGPLQVSFAAADKKLVDAVNKQHGLKAQAPAKENPFLAATDTGVQVKATGAQLAAKGSAKPDHSLSI